MSPHLSKKPLIAALAFLGFMLFVTALAYARHIPGAITAIPHYDSVGHFLLFGIFGLLSHLALGRRAFSFFGARIPLGPVLAIMYATVDEFLQYFSPNRTLDLYDLLFGVLGIGFFVSIDFFVRRKN